MIGQQRPSYVLKLGVQCLPDIFRYISFVEFGEITYRGEILRVLIASGGG